MLLDLSTLAVDAKKAIEGVWVKHSGAEFKLARYNNPNASAARSAAIAEFYTEIKDVENLEDDKFSERYRLLNAKVFAEHVLIDWKSVGLPNDKGEAVEVKYTPEVGFTILGDINYYELYQFLLEESIRHDGYALKNEEAIVEDVKGSANS